MSTAKRLRKPVTANKRDLKKEYFPKAFEEAGADNKKLWGLSKNYLARETRKIISQKLMAVGIVRLGHILSMIFFL